MVETRVNWIGCLKLRLEQGVAISIYGTLCLPIINHRDPLTAKLIRAAHWVNRDVPRAVHNLTKTTIANLVRGEMAVYWKGQRGDVTRAISNCGVCRKFDERSCRPSLGKNLFRCRIRSQPFQHVSLDPLVSVRVILYGNHTGKIVPLIVCDLNTGALAVESMQRGKGC